MSIESESFNSKVERGPENVPVVEMLNTDEKALSHLSSEQLSRPENKARLASVVFASLLAGCSSMQVQKAEVLEKMEDVATSQLGPETVARQVARRTVEGTPGRIVAEVAGQTVAWHVEQQRDKLNEKFITNVQERLLTGGGEVRDEAEGMIYNIRPATIEELAEELEKLEEAERLEREEVERTEAYNQALITTEPKSFRDLTSLERKEFRYDQYAYRGTKFAVRTAIVATPIAVEVALIGPTKTVTRQVINRLSQKVGEEVSERYRYLDTDQVSSLEEYRNAARTETILHTPDGSAYKFEWISTFDTPNDYRLIIGDGGQ
jgi:hypothetical protein